MRVRSWARMLLAAGALLGATGCQKQARQELRELARGEAKEAAHQLALSISWNWNWDWSTAGWPLIVVAVKLEPGVHSSYQASLMAWKEAKTSCEAMEYEDVVLYEVQADRDAFLVKGVCVARDG